MRDLANPNDAPGLAPFNCLGSLGALSEAQVIRSS
jgi:hypothetical protein